jgi:hypothetical protein
MRAPRRRRPRRSPAGLRTFPADAVFARGPDAVGILLLRCYRSFSLVLVGLGLCIATWSQAINNTDADLSTPGGIVHALVTPLATLAVGVVARVTVTPLAWALAMLFVAVSNPEMSPAPKRNTAWKRLMDQTRMASAYRPLRWTTSVRDAAVESLGTTGRVLYYAEGVLRAMAALTGVLWVVSISRM